MRKVHEMRKVEEMPEYMDTKALEERYFKLSTEGQVQFVRNLISQACWHSETRIDREWLQKEVESQEQSELPNLKLVDDHPTEDHFGSEIQSGDVYFKDQAGREVLVTNWEDYLIEVGGVQFYRVID